MQMKPQFLEDAPERDATAVLLVPLLLLLLFLTIVQYRMHVRKKMALVKLTAPLVNLKLKMAATEPVAVRFAA